MVRMIPGFAPRLWLWAWRNKPGIRCWLFAEACAAAGLLLLGTILYITHASPLLLVYGLSTLGTSWVGYTLVSWLSHQSAILQEPRKQALAGTLLGSVLVFFFGVIIFHEEHHAEEAVPSCNLARFAKDVEQETQGHNTANPLST
jgi:fatty acid desaturase